MAWATRPWCAALLAGSSLACAGGGGAPPQPPRAHPASRAAQVPDDDACRALRNPSEPALVTWDADERAQVKVLARHGVVAVRYFVNGCSAALEVLPRCTASERYVFSPGSASHHEIIWKPRDLLSAYPLGAATLKDEIADQRVLRVDFTEDGVASLAAGASFPASALRGPDCARATHVVARIVLGEFAVATGGAAVIREFASQSAEISDDPGTRVAHLAEEGDARTCGSARTSIAGIPLCPAALRVALVPLQGAPPAAPACPPADRWVGPTCVPRLGTACTAGLHFAAARGCVPDDAAPSSIQTLETWYAANEKDEALALRLVSTAYQVAEQRFVAGAGDPNTWWQRTVSAFERWQRAGAKRDAAPDSPDSPESYMAAEAAYRIADAEIVKTFDYDTGHHHYSGAAADVVHRLEADAAQARTLSDALTAIVETYRLPEWTTAALAREGSLYDALRTGMAHAHEPAIALFDDETLHLLEMADASDNPRLVAKARTVRAKVRAAWRGRAALEIDSAAAIAINRYATAIAVARRYHVRNAIVAQTLRRLEVLEALVGTVKMTGAMQNVPGLEYTPGMFTRM